MISYELALKLKNAGFPQSLRGGIKLSPSGKIFPGATTVDLSGDLVYIPTLEELIKTCGNGFQDLNRGYDDWECNVEHFNHDIGFPEATGSTPEEAVAELWLKLNKGTHDQITTEN